MKKRVFSPPYLWIVGITIAALCIIAPLFRSGFISTDDGGWMVIRLSAFYQSLREGQIPVRFLGRLNNSYGYPVSNFLYPGFLYIGSLLHYVGFSFITSIELIFAGAVLMSGIFTFLWLRKHTSDLSSFVGSLSVLFGPYLFFDIYKRGSIGEVLAIGVVSTCLYFLDSKKYFLLGFAFLLLIISHNSLALLFIMFFFTMFIFRRDLKGVVSLIFGIGMATFFWFPAFYEKHFVLFDSVLVSKPQEYFVQGTLIPLVGIFSLLALLWYVIKKPKGLSRAYIGGYIISMILATPLTQFIWHIDDFAKLFQFPYRMLSGALLFGSYLIAVMLEKNSLRMKIVLLILFSMISIWQVTNAYPSIVYTNQPEGYYVTNEATTTVANEYMPIWVREMTTERPTVRMGFEKGRGTISFTTQTTQKIDAQIQTAEESILQINSIYYPGWGVIVNNIPVKLSYDNPNGLIRFPVGAGSFHVVAEFRETVQRFIADIISVSFFVAYCLLWIFQKSKRTI